MPSARQSIRLAWRDGNASCIAQRTFAVVGLISHSLGRLSGAIYHPIEYQDHAGSMAYNVLHVCDAAPSLTEARGHVAERRAAAPRSPSRPEGAAMHIRAVMSSCARLFAFLYGSKVVFQGIDRFQITRIGYTFSMSTPISGTNPLNPF